LVTTSGDGWKWYVDPKKIVTIEPGRVYAVSIRKRRHLDGQSAESFDSCLELKAGGQYRIYGDSTWVSVKGGNGGNWKRTSPLQMSIVKSTCDLFDFVFGKGGW
jgi:hypothetical protein